MRTYSPTRADPANHESDCERNADKPRSPYRRYLEPGTTASRLTKEEVRVCVGCHRVCLSLPPRLLEVSLPHTGMGECLPGQSMQYRELGPSPASLTADGAMARPAGHIKQLQTRAERRRDARGIIRSPLTANYPVHAPLPPRQAMSTSGQVHYWTLRPGPNPMAPQLLSNMKPRPISLIPPPVSRQGFAWAAT